MFTEEESMKKIYLVGRSGVHANERIPVEGEIVLGRDAKVCQLVYPAESKKISGTHCKLREMNGNLCLIDMNSTNGTFFEDGTRLEPNMPRPIGDGQGFYLSSRDNSFDIKIEIIPEYIEPPKKKSDFKIQYVLIPIVILLIFALGVGAYIYSTQQRMIEEQQQQIENQQQRLEEEEDEGLGDIIVDGINEFFN